MIVRCYGARGSIPVSGEEYLKYGGDSTCIEVRTNEDSIIIVDAGSGIRRLGNRLLAEERYEYTLFFTHSHWDHILGFPFFRPLYAQQTVIHLHGCPTAQGNIQMLLSKAMSAPFFPVPFDKLQAKIHYDAKCFQNIRIDGMEISMIPLSHPNGGLGFKFAEEGKTFVFLTDNELGYRHQGGLTPEEYVRFAHCADLLIHDSEYTPEQYRNTIAWGHSTYVDALDLALAAGVKSLGLFHHNQDRKDSDQDQIVRQCQETVEERKAELSCFAMTQNTELSL